MAKSSANWLGTVATAVALLATLTTAVGGYYDVRARGEQTSVSLVQLREQTTLAVKAIADRQEWCESIALTRWAKVDEVLDQLLIRGVRNETNIVAILEAVKTMSDDLKKHVRP